MIVVDSRSYHRQEYPWHQDWSQAHRRRTLQGRIHRAQEQGTLGYRRQFLQSHLDLH